MLDDILLGNYKLAAANLGLTIEGRIRDMEIVCIACSASTACWSTCGSVRTP